jgi:DNA sulfur modification protein DndB
MARPIRLRALRGRSAGREVILGFAPAKLLYDLSFADVLNEDTGSGYQRRFSDPHSLDFRRYIRLDGSTTIPLTFNLRPRSDRAWRIQRVRQEVVELVVRLDAGKVLSQVDCQHRIGHIGDLDVMLPFMVIVGLNPRDEMEVFKTINSKAKGLSGSLLDYHAARLADDLGLERPELFISLQLNETESSPWYKQLDLGGNATSGLKRRASLRTMQKAVKRFLTSTAILEKSSPNVVAKIVMDFWTAVARVLRDEWLEPRKHLLTKGVGVYALMGVLGDLWNESVAEEKEPNTSFFITRLSDFVHDFDWSTQGSLNGLGGESGAQKALELMRDARARDNRHLRLLHG